MKWTEAAIVAALRETFLPDVDHAVNEEWALLTQVPLRVPGEGRWGAGKWGANERTIDVLLVRTWATGIGFDRLAVEIKVSVADYRAETDAKRAPAWASAHRCCYAAPAGLIDPTSLPTGWGLIEVHPEVQTAGRPVGSWRSRCTWRSLATRHEPTCDLDYLISAGFRRASRAEERIRRGDLPAAEVARMRDELERANLRVYRAEQAKRRETERAKAARAELLALEGAQECADCGARVTFVRAGSRASTWQHTDEAAGRACQQARAEADRVRREAEHGAAYAWGFAGPVEPVALRRLADDEPEPEGAAS
jgi:hypothetical protein